MILAGTLALALPRSSSNTARSVTPLGVNT